MLTRSLNFRLNRSNKNDPRRRAEPEAVTSAEEQGQLLRLNRQELVDGQKYESVKLQDLESLAEAGSSDSEAEQVQIVGVKRTRKQGPHLPPSKRVRFDDAMPKSSSASGVK